MPPTAFDGVFDDVTISREVRELRDPPEVNAAGDPLYDVTTQELRVIADSSDRDTLRERYGANAGEVVLILTLLEPSVAPANVQPGTEFALSYAGRPGIVRIAARPVETLSPITQILGEVLYGVWRPS
ncbi:hypothetical protein [Natronococcus sp.]|uniref:hypothetical protein n=1 Tax=Natronococcus sp. TaxID=35747 RepID=UPI003A4DFCBE